MHTVLLGDVIMLETREVYTWLTGDPKSRLDGIKAGLASWQLVCDSGRCSKLAAVSMLESSSHGLVSEGDAAFKLSNKDPQFPSLAEGLRD